jgi:flagellar M-ring protein FliF
MSMFVLALVALLMLRSMVRSALSVSVGEISSPAPRASAPRVVLPPEEPEPPMPPLKRRLKSGPSLREQLGELVREDPDTAAAILRNWIGSTT